MTSISFIASIMPPMNSASRHFACMRALAILAIVMACSNVTHAAMTDSGWRAMSDDRLDELRGGFDTGTGLQISIGIQRAVYINGNLVTTASLNIPDTGKMTATQADALRTSAGTLDVIRHGAGNMLAQGPISSSTMATVVQNTLNNQNIKNLTVIDATVSSLGALKTMNFQAGLRDALSLGAGGR